MDGKAEWVKKPVTLFFSQLITRGERIKIYKNFK